MRRHAWGRADQGLSEAGTAFYREADAYFAGLLRRESPSARYDELHALWRHAVRLQRAGLKEYADAFDHAGTFGAWRKGSRLTGKAETPDEASSKLFERLLRDAATADQVHEVNRRSSRYEKEVRGQ